MEVNLLATLSLIGSLITLVGAIWKVAEAKSEIQNKIDRADIKLDRKIEAITGRLEDKITELENHYQLTYQINLTEEKNYKLILEGRLESLLERLRNLKQDVYDLQRFLQASHGFKLRFNTSTLNDKNETES